MTVDEYPLTSKVIALATAATLLIPQSIIAANICITFEDVLKVIVSVAMTLGALYVLTLIFGDYLSRRMLVKSALQPLLLGGLLAGVLHTILFVWLFRELSDNFLFQDNLVNLYVFSQTVSYAILLASVAYLSSE